MKKIVVLLTILILVLTNITVFAEMDLNSPSAILLDYNTGQVIFSKNEKEKLPPASITKIMNLLIVMELLSDGNITLEDKVAVSENASKTPGTTIYLDRDEVQTVDNLIKAISIRSANDAAVALAEHISGSEAEFVKLMNKKAKSLGMNNTNFSNCTGLSSDNHYTTASDIGKMSKALLDHNMIYDYLNTYMEDIEVGKTKKSIQTMVNTNRLIKDYVGANGIKTGYTSEAKHCISASAKRDNLHLIAVVMKSDSSDSRFKDAKTLLDFGFSNYKTLTIGSKGDIITGIEIQKGKKNLVDLVLERDCHILLKKEVSAEVEKLVNIPSFMEAPIKENQIVGELVIKSNGKIVDTVNLLAKEEVGTGSIFNILNKVIRNFLFNI